MRVSALCWLLFAAVAAGGCARCSRRAGARADVGVALAIPSYVHAVAWIAADHGDFRAAGIHADVAVMGGSAATARALLANSSQVGLLGGDAVIKADAAGGDLVIVAGLVNRFYHRLIGRPGIHSVDDLRGKKIGLPFVGGPQDMAVRYALRSHGLRYGKDVAILNLGRQMNRMAALAHGDIDATTSQTPPEQLAKLGFTVLDDLPAQPVAFPYMMVAVRRSYLQHHPDRVRAVLLGLCRATRFYRRHRDASLALIAGHLHGSDTANAARERYRESGPSFLSWPPVPDRAGLERVIKFLGAQRSGGAAQSRPDHHIDLGSLVDLHILDRLRSHGECGGH